MSEGIVRVHMTQAGYDKMQAELRQMRSVERPQNIEEIARAREYGDIAENAEFHAAKERQAMLDARIRDFEGKLARAEVVDTSRLPTDRIVFGVVVTLLDLRDDSEIRYQIVGADEAEASAGKISLHSPIARALIGREPGDEVEVEVPGGRRSLEILEVARPED